MQSNFNQDGVTSVAAAAALVARGLGAQDIVKAKGVYGVTCRHPVKGYEARYQELRDRIEYLKGQRFILRLLNAPRLEEL